MTSNPTSYRVSSRDRDAVDGGVAQSLPLSISNAPLNSSEPGFAAIENWIVVPCYNEAERLDLGAFEHYCGAQPSVGFVFVNDGSTDNTALRLNEICHRVPRQTSLLDLKQNSGKAEAVRRGIQVAIRMGAKFTGYWDADLATPLDAILPMLQVAHRRPELVAVLGCRVPMLGREIQRQPLRRFQSRLFARATSRVLKTRVIDTQCGAKVLRVSPTVQQLFGSPFLTRWIFDVEWLARLRVLEHDNTELRHLVYEYPLDRWQEVAGSKLTMRAALRAATQLSTIARHVIPGRWTPSDDADQLGEIASWYPPRVPLRKAA